jgi:hypothetical protein
MDHFCDYQSARRTLVFYSAREGALLEVRANAGYKSPRSHSACFPAPSGRKKPSAPLPSDCVTHPKTGAILRPQH